MVFLPNSSLLSVVPNTVEMTHGSNQEATRNGDRRGDDTVLHVDFGKDFEFILVLEAHDIDYSTFARGIKVPPGNEWGRVEITPGLGERTCPMTFPG